MDMNIDQKQICQICADEKHKRAMFTCPKCKFVCCQGCVRNFLLSSSSQIPTCMNCKVGWDLDFIADNMETKFVDKYREHRAKIMLSLEKSLLPFTQEDVNKEIKLREHNEFVKEGNANVKKINKWEKSAEEKQRKCLEKYSHYKFTEEDPEKAEKYMKKWHLIRDQIEQCEESKHKIQRAISRAKLEFRIVERLEKEKKITKKVNVYIGSCPQDDCKGYINRDYVCGLCEKKVCKKCRIPVHDGECNKDTVETVKMLETETKPCPKCMVPIFKIDGCDQIWCTSCHTAFSWNTGEVETGRIHNPHYYQWMRENGGLPREQGDVPQGDRCNGLHETDFHRLINKARHFSQDVRSDEEYLMTAFRLIFHIRHVSLLTYGVRQNDDILKGIRVRYMIGDFDEKRWLSLVKSRQKSTEINTSMTLLLTMCANTIEDLIRSIITCNWSNDYELCLNQMKELNKYVGENIEKLKKRFKVKMMSFGPEWQIIYI